MDLGPRRLDTRSRDTLTQLPPGFLGNPSAFPKCGLGTFLNQVGLVGWNSAARWKEKR